MNIQRKIANTGALVGLTAVLSGCMISQPNGNGGVSSLFIPKEVFQGIYDGISVKSNQQNQQQLPSNKPRPLGSTPFSYAFEYIDRANPIGTSVSDLKNIRSDISLSQHNLIRFATEIKNLKGQYCTLMIYQDNMDSPKYIAPEIQLEHINTFVEFPVPSSTLRDNGVHPGEILINFKVRDEGMRQHNLWQGGTAADAYTFKIRE